MIISAKTGVLNIFYEETLTPDKNPGDPGYVYPSIKEISSLKITKEMFPDVLYVKKDYYLAPTFFENTKKIIEHAYFIQLKHILLQFYDSNIAKKYLEIFCHDELDNKILSRDYPELNL